VANSTGTFKRYSFGNPSSDSNNFAANLVGEVTPDYSSGQWVDYAVNFTSLGSAISGLSGNVYVAVGINHNTAVTYYLDNLTFHKDELIKQPGAALSGTLTIVSSSITPTGVEITANSVTVPAGSTQTIEYAVSPTGSADRHWQPGRVFTGLSANTGYTAHARAAANALYNAGAVKDSAPFTTLSKPTGATVSSPTSAQITHSRITLNAVTAPANGQTVEYGINTTNSAPSAWQTVTTFSGLSPSTPYYVFARAKENDNYGAGPATSGVSMSTLAKPALNPVVPAIIVDFEDDALGATTKYTVTPGNGSGTVTIVNDPVYAGQKSLNMNSTNYNRGAVIPINLPFALENYQSFTFRFKLAGGTPSNTNISVYVADAVSKFVNYGFGNPANNQYQFANLLLGSVEPNFAAAQWVEYEITIPDDAANFNTIKDLRGNIYLAIGINSSGTIDLLFDDLTFNAVSNFTPGAAAITPTTATFVTSAPADIDVTVYPYGRTLSSITNGAATLTDNTHYTVTNLDSYSKKVTLKASYFMSLTGVTTVTLTFNFSSGASSNIVIAIRGTSVITAYNFATDRPAVTSSSNVTATISNGVNGVLTVNRTDGYGSPSQVMIPFDLGVTPLSSFTKLQLVVKCSNDFQNKSVVVSVSSDSGSTWTNIATTNTNVNSSNDWTQSFKTVNINISGAGTLSGPILIRLQWESSNPVTYEFQSIGLTN